MTNSKLFLSAFLTLLIIILQTRAEAQWKRCGPQGGSVTSFAVLGSTLFAGTAGSPDYPSQGSGVLQSSDSGATWYESNAGLSDTNVLALTSENANLFASTASAGVFRSTDGGSSWKALPGLKTTKPVCAFAVIGRIVLAATDSEGIFVSGDEGITWKVVNAGLKEQNIHKLAVIGSVVFANASFDGEGGVYRSSDSGKSWSEVSKSMFDIAAVGSTLFGCVYGGQGGVMFSEDSGVTWQLRGGSFGGHGVFYSLASFGSVVFSFHTQKYGEGVAHSSDSGKSWTTDSGLNGLNVVAILGTNLFVGNADGMFRSPIAGTVQTNAVAEVDDRSSTGTNGLSMITARVYPNPVSESATIRVVSRESGNAQITIVNLLGSEVARIFSGELAAGEHSLTWTKPSGLSAGLYECVLRVAGRMEQVPMMVVR
jgi:hypothetical protein